MRPGVKLQDNAAKILPVEVGVNLSGGYGSMSQHFLHRPEVSAALNKVCGKRMPERMRAHRFMQPGEFSMFLNDGKDHYPAQFVSPAVHK